MLFYDFVLSQTGADLQLHIAHCTQLSISPIGVDLNRDAMRLDKFTY